MKYPKQVQVYLCLDPALTPLLLSTRIPTVVTHMMLTYPRYGQRKESEKARKREKEKLVKKNVTRASNQIHTSTLTDNQALVQRGRFAGLTVQPRTLAVLCATVDWVWLQFCFANQNHQLLVEKERVNIFRDFVQQAEFYIFHFGISGKSPSPFGAYRQHKRSLTNRFFLTTRLSKEKGIQ
ncbi:hypothetical protein T01_4638 [Trichinella spiralis]|uniref:Uncharacterized protein n=1 Tax=Trichinella spiralis TaxID=6334 RepID=A0A0V1BQ97_TRISP|nr:hypothetical protein T01_4638 [Trichinella spiralis]